MGPLKTIFPLEEDNNAGAITLRLARIKDISSFPRNILGVIYNDIEFIPGEGWELWSTIFATLSFASSPKDSSEGYHNDSIVNFSIPGKRFYEYDFNELQKAKLVLLVTDSNLNTWIFGSPQRPVRFSYNKNTGNIGSGRNEFSCSFSGKNERVLYKGTFKDKRLEYLYIRRGMFSGELIKALSEDESYTVENDSGYNINVFVIPKNPQSTKTAELTYLKDGVLVTEFPTLGKTVVVGNCFNSGFKIQPI